MKRLLVLCGVVLLGCCITFHVHVPREDDDAEDAAASARRLHRKILMALAPPDGDTSGHAGFLLGSPAGITASTPSASIVIKTAGFAALDPASDAMPGPDFGLFEAQVFSEIPASLSQPQQPVLAMSLGLEVIEATLKDTVESDDSWPSDPPGLPTPHYAIIETLPGFGGWVAFEFSVNTAEIGTNPVTPVAPDIKAARLAGAGDRTVFSYLVPGETPTLEVEYESVSAMGPEKFDLSTSDEINGLDMHMALYATDLGLYPGVFTTRPLRPDPWLYFTIRPAFWAALTPMQRQTLSWVGTDPTGTIYRAHWNPTANPAHWDPPVVYLPWDHLAGSAETPQVIDGLSMDVDDSKFSTGADAKILFSTDDSAPPANQIRFAMANINGPNTERPRRVVIKKRDGSGYGSLGVQLGAGSGIGDFCTKDPWLTTQSPPPILDDFFVARRLLRDHFCEDEMPAVSVVSPVWVHQWQEWWQRFGIEQMRTAGPKPPLGDAPRLRSEVGPIPEPGPHPWPGPDLKPWPPILPHPFLHPVVVVPHLYDFVVLPQIALAVSGYRQRLKNEAGNAVPHMRTCMSWPNPTATSGTATLCWGKVADVRFPVIEWDHTATQTFAYVGEPLVAKRALLDPAPQPGTYRAMVAQWKLEAGGNIYISHVSALRY